jgi:type I restriction enzyme M protein
MSGNELDIKTLETWLWEAACKIRGEIDAPKYKDYILPPIFLKRLSYAGVSEGFKMAGLYVLPKVVEVMR